MSLGPSALGLDCQGLSPEGDSCPAVGAAGSCALPQPGGAPASTVGLAQGGRGRAVPWCLMSVGSRSMSLSDRDVPMAKAIFFIWEEKSSSILALQGTGSRLGGCAGQERVLCLDPAWCQLLALDWGPQAPRPRRASGCRGRLEGPAFSAPWGPGLAEAFVARP